MKRPIAYDPRAVRLTVGPRPYRDPRGRNPSLPEIANIRSHGGSPAREAYEGLRDLGRVR